MYRRGSRKQEVIKRIFVYGIMTSLVLLIVTALVFVILGYRFDANNGRVEQTGLIQFDTTPSGATIRIDGNTIGSNTPSKSSVSAGKHTFVMQRNGYEAWQKTLDVTVGTLTWFNYARLVPKDKTVTPVAQYTSIHASLANADGHDILIQQDATVPTFQLVNLQSDTIKTSTITIPAQLYSVASAAGVTHDFRIDQWDKDGRYVLLQHKYGLQEEWLVLDTKDVAATKNITTLLDVRISSAKFSGAGGATLYALVEGDIRKLDLSANTISRAFVSHVTSFDLFEENNVITYVGIDSADSTKRVVGVYRDGDNNPYVLRTVKTSTGALHVAISRYFNQNFVAIAEGNQIDILSGNYPSSDSDSFKKYGTFNFSDDVNKMSFSPKGYYLLVQSFATFSSYDIEHQTVSSSSITDHPNATINPLKWLDTDYVWSDYGENLVICEFDGANSHIINKTVLGQDATLSANSRYLYSIGKIGEVYQLQRVRMILP